MRYFFFAVFVFATISSYSQWSGTNPVWFTAGNVGIGTQTPSSKLDVHVGFPSVVATGLSVYRGGDPNYGIKLLTGVGDGATYDTWNGGIGSWYGIAFYSHLDNTTRGVFNVRDGSFTLKGNINSQADGVFNGNLLLGTNPGTTSMISGVAYSGAIQIKTNGSIGGAANRYLRLGVKDNNSVFYPVMSITDDQNAGIGTVLTSNPNGYKLAVNGKIGAKEVQVENTSSTWADYVFEPDYNLAPLKSVEEFIKANKHLPEIPSAEEVKVNGHMLGEMDVLLLKKVEELTLYMIEQSKTNQQQALEIELLKAQLEMLKNK